VHPIPAGHPLEPDVWSAVVDDVETTRQAAIQNWEAALDAEAEVDDEGTLYDPVLSEIAAARREVIEAEQRLRLLLAYAREFVAPRPYTRPARRARPHRDPPAVPRPVLHPPRPGLRRAGMAAKLRLRHPARCRPRRRPRHHPGVHQGQTYEPAQPISPT
jgi:hypothetical protein